MVAERIDPAGLNLEERIVDIWRCAKVVKGGRRFSFAAMAVVGNGRGVAGMGYGKGREVPIAIEKAVKDARKNLVRVNTYGTTIPHEVRGQYGTARIILIPALPGTGVIAGASVRAVLEAIGVHDVLSKSVGKTTNAKNVVKATFEGLSRLRSREEVANLRGVAIPDDPLMLQNLRAMPETSHAARPPREERPRRRGRGPHGGERQDAAESKASAAALPPPEASASPEAAPPAAEEKKE